MRRRETNRRAEKDDSLSRYLSEIGGHPLLPTREEMEIAADAKRCGTREPLNRLVESNLSFVVRVASDYRNLGVPFEDLINEGNIGLIHAAHRYNPARGTKFITYAIWWIRKSILKALSEQSSVVRVPTYQMKRVKRVRETERCLAGSLGRRPDRHELSRELASSISQVDAILQIKLRELSLDDNSGTDAAEILDRLLHSDGVSPEDEFLRAERRSLVRSALALLSDQEHAVIVNRFGLSGDRSFTLREIGDSMGLSRERIRQIEVQARGKLRRILLMEFPMRPSRRKL